MEEIQAVLEQHLRDTDHLDQDALISVDLSDDEIRYLIGMMEMAYTIEARSPMAMGSMELKNMAQTIAAFKRLVGETTNG